MDDERNSAWPPRGHSPYLPTDFQGMNDPGNDPPEVLLDEDGVPVDDVDDEVYEDTDDNYEDE